MPDFDAQQVVDSVRAGTTPSSWLVFRAQRRYFFIMGIGLIAAALVCFVGTALFAFADWTAPDAGSPCLTFGLGLLGLGIAVRAVYLLGQLKIADEQWLVVTPDGFADYRGQKRGVASAVAYRLLDAISLRISTSRRSRSVSISLDLTYKVALAASHLRHTEWMIDQRFGRQEEIAQAIIEAHARYVAAGATASE